MPLLRFVVEFVQVLRERVAVQVAVRVAEQRVPVQVVHKRVAVAEHIARVVPWVLPLSSRRVPH